MRRGWFGVALAAALAGSVYPRVARADDDDDPPMIDRDKPFLCLADGEERLWRVQCVDAPDKKCLYAPNAETSGGKLERALPCYPAGVFDMKAYEAQGYRMVRAVADAPFGWWRDKLGRVSQYNFDLNKRLYVGGSFSPVLSPVSDYGRASVDFGLLVFQHTGTLGESRARHRISLVEGEVQLSPFGARVVAVHYDASLRYSKPLVRVTTFFGKPRRYDARLNVGWWFEGGDLEIHQTPAGSESLWRFATAHVTADLYQSDDLSSFVRARIGVGIERTYAAEGADRQGLTPGAAIDADFTLDRNGWNHVTGELVWERPLYSEADPALGKRSERVRGELAFERILIGLNDQPVTARLAASVSKRDDIPNVTPDWVYTATAGLRLSLWAPPRQRSR